MPTWDPARYLQFADDRARPFVDLLAHVPTDPETIVDLGCGPGHLTKYLRDRWPHASILGIDSSQAMIETALRENTDPATNYDIADVAEYVPAAPTDLFISNAMFQWVPDQFAAIERLLPYLNDGGVVAIQVPDNADAGTHRTLDALAREEPYAQYLSGVRRVPRTAPEEYLDFFAARGFEVNAWSTTYRHVLGGDQPVFDWITGTGARPFFEALPAELRVPFADELKVRLRAAYPPRPYGTVLPFRRTFAVATDQSTLR